MRVALHPERDEQIDTEQFNILGLESARCPVCNGVMRRRAGIRQPHFSHTQDKIFCATKSRLGRPYLALRPTEPDPDARRYMKIQFRRNWQRHFSFIKELLPRLSVGEFIDMMKLAIRNDIFAYRDIMERDIPYLLLMTRDFPPWTGLPATTKLKSRMFYFRFWFKANVQAVRDLWIRRNETLIFQRASYKLSDDYIERKRRPVELDIMRIAQFEVSDEFLRATDGIVGAT